MTADIYQNVTDSIIAMLERGVRPWAPQWDNGACGLPAIPTRANGEAYRGINIAILWGTAEIKGYRHHTWMTFNQAKALGGCVRKGEKGTGVVYWGTFKAQADDSDDTAGDDGKARLFAKGYTVFNVDQIDGLPAKFFEAAPVASAAERIKAADAWAIGSGADIRHGGSKAFFSPSGDFVQMPPLEAFYEPQAYYSTLAHELTHWTGHKSRLAREFGKRFGSQAYAFEELIAELGAAYAMARLGIASEPREDHASYLASWLKVLKADKRAIFTAASKAQAACDDLFARAEKAAVYTKPVQAPAEPLGVICLPDLSNPVSEPEIAPIADPEPVVVRVTFASTDDDDDTPPPASPSPMGSSFADRVAAFGRKGLRPFAARRVHARLRPLAPVPAPESDDAWRAGLSDGAVAEACRDVLRTGHFANGGKANADGLAWAQSELDSALARIDAATPRPVPARPFHPRRDPSLCEYLSLKGICDDGGELKARDLDRWHREAPFRRKLVRADGVSLETAARMAWEAGYFDDVAVPSWDSSDNMHPVTPDMLLVALDRELRDDYAHVWAEHDEEFFT